MCGRGWDAVVCEEIVTGGELIVSVVVWVVGKMLCARSGSWGSLCGRSRPPLAHDTMILPTPSVLLGWRPEGYRTQEARPTTSVATRVTACIALVLDDAEDEARSKVF